MTDREKAIVMAHTGVCMLTGDKFNIFHRYVEEIMGRPVFTHEIGWIADAIKEKSTTDFLALCREVEESEDCVSRQAIEDAFEKAQYSRDFCKEHHIDYSISMEMVRIILHDIPPVTPAEKVGRWVYNKNLSTYYGDVYTCSECGERCLESCYDHIDKLPNFCPKCHTKMEVEE